jgi:hypothetical protein
MRIAHIIVLALLGLVLLAAPAQAAQAKRGPGHTARPCGGAFEPHFEDSYFGVGRQCRFSAEVLAGKKHFHRGANTVDLVLHAKSGKDVPMAELDFSVRGPDGEQRLHPKVEDRLNGTYHVSGLKLPALEHRALMVRVRHKQGNDAILIPLSMDPGGSAMQGHVQETWATKGQGTMGASGKGAMQGKHGGDMHMDKQPPQDLGAREKTTREGTYRVAYQPKDQPMPLNDFTAWTLTVETPGGAPVNGEVSVDGDMPRHGHGLVTSPIAEGTKPGTYLVQGLKFHMPGWWQMVFTIDGPKGKDQVAFDFMVGR